MIKLISLITATLLLTSHAYAGGVTYNFKPEYVAKIIEGTCYLYNNTELNDPDDPESGLKYTDAQWTKERYRRIIIRDTRRGLAEKQRDNQEPIDVPDDAVETQ